MSVNITLEYNMFIIYQFHRSPPEKQMSSSAAAAAFVWSYVPAPCEPTGPLRRPAECRPVQMPFTQKHDTRASHAAVPKGRRRPVFRTHLRSRRRLIISTTCSGPPVNYNYYRGVQQFFVLKIAFQTTCLLL